MTENTPPSTAKQTLQPIHPWTSIQTGQWSLELEDHYPIQRLISNWRNYGRPEWIDPSTRWFVQGPFWAVIASLALFTLVGASPLLDLLSEPLMLFLFALPCGSISFLFLSIGALFYMQWHAYRAWKKKPLDQTLLEHRYPFTASGFYLLLISIGPPIFFIWGFTQ
jgi:hypothetical protein